MTTFIGRVSIIGAGTMGLAYARTFLKAQLISPQQLTVFESVAERAAAIGAELGCASICSSTMDLSREDIIFFAIKPQDFAQVCSQIKSPLRSEQVLVSIMAGITTETLHEKIYAHRAIVRVMPNTPAQVGAGISVVYSDKQLPAARREAVEYLLRSTGVLLSVQDERLLDAATAVSGSGPAYVCYFLEHLQAAAQSLGFSQPEAELLARETFLGTTALLRVSGLAAAELRRSVTSPQGTTAAAIQFLDQTNTGRTFQRAVLAACERAQKIGQEKGKI